MKKEDRKSVKKLIERAKKLEEQRPATLLHAFHPLSDDWKGTEMAFELLEKFIEERHNVLRCYPGFAASFPTWQEEMGQVRRIKARVQKLVWDEAHRKHKKSKNEAA